MLDFHGIYLPTMEVSGDQQIFGSTKLFKIYIFVCVCVFNIREKLTQVWNDMRVSKW